MKQGRKIVTTALAALATTLASSAVTAQNYPSRVVEVILPYPPGPSVQRCGDVTVITFGAHPDHAVGDRIAAQLEGRAEGLGRGHLLLDFRRIDRISSEELGTLIRLQKITNAAGGRLTLFNLRPSVLEVFMVTHLDRILAICRGHAPESGEAHATPPPQENS